MKKTRFLNIYVHQEMVHHEISEICASNTTVQRNAISCTGGRIGTEIIPALLVFRTLHGCRIKYMSHSK